MGKRKSREEPEALPMVDGAEDNPTDMSPEPKPKKTKKDKREKKEKKEKGEKREKKEKKEKKEKRKHREEPDALPDADIAEDETPVSVADDPTHKKDKKDRKQKSKKRRINEEGDAAEVDETGKTGEDVADEEGKESKLSKKAKWRAARRKRTEEAEDGGGDDGGDVEGDVMGEEGPDEVAEGWKTKKHRFLLFIGNLPYTATAEDVEKHFAKIKPQRVRLLTKKSEDGSEISRGCAFIELDSARMMDKALLRMHHSEFDDGKSEKRKINVEVTAGGGGSNPARMEKIKAKNAKLDEERARKAQKAADLKEAEKNNKEKKARAEDDANNEGEAEDLKAQEEKGKEDEQDDTAGVHPSRLAQMSSNYQDRSWEGRENGDRRGGFKGGRGGGRGFSRGRGRGRGRGGNFRSGRGGRRGGGGGFRGVA